MLLLSCEHGGNRVPEPWTALFTGQERLLESHRAYDIGIAAFARRLARELTAPLHLAEVTRLLVELNRSPGHPAVFSEITRPLPKEQRTSLLEHYYHPYRSALTRHIEQLLATRAGVCHISLHSFTPELHGEVRNADIGLLYDPRRPRERQFCLNWQENITRRKEGWRVRRNYPYRGAADSLFTPLRRRFPAERYLGFELELNQFWSVNNPARWESLQRLITETLRETLEQKTV